MYVLVGQRLWSLQCVQAPHCQIKATQQPAFISATSFMSAWCVSALTSSLNFTEYSVTLTVGAHTECGQVWNLFYSSHCREKKQ